MRRYVRQHLQLSRKYLDTNIMPVKSDIFLENSDVTETHTQNDTFHLRCVESISVWD